MDNGGGYGAMDNDDAGGDGSSDEPPVHHGGGDDSGAASAGNSNNEASTGIAQVDGGSGGEHSAMVPQAPTAPLRAPAWLHIPGQIF